MEWQTVIIDKGEPGFDEWLSSLYQLRNWLFQEENDPYTGHISHTRFDFRITEYNYERDDMYVWYEYGRPHTDLRRYARSFVIRIGDEQLNIQHNHRLHGTAGRIIIEYLGQGTVE